MSGPTARFDRDAAAGDKTYYVYILLCERDLLYTGYTDDIERRMRSHNGGRAGAKFTRSFRPLGIAQCWRIGAGKSAALKIERYIKKMPREAKLALIAAPERLGDMISEDIGLDSPAAPCLNDQPVCGFALGQPHNRT